MAEQVNPIIHEFAVLLASMQEGKRRLDESTVKNFYGNYLIAVKTLTELEKDEEFQKNPTVPQQIDLK